MIIITTLVLLVGLVQCGVYASDCNGGNNQDKISSLPGYPVSAPRLQMYSGFVEVNKTANGSLFYWLIESIQTNATNKADIPILIWLNGGPGASSLTGLFRENGPFTIGTDTSQLLYNNYSWIQHYHMLFIDNPIGTGFSYCSNDCYVINQDMMGEQLIEFIYNFFNPSGLCHAELFNNPLYITGESFAGKYIAFITKWYLKRSQIQELPSLQGIAIGDGSYNPYIQYPSAVDYAYNLGIIDEKTWTETLDKVHFCLYNLTQTNMSFAVDYCLNVTNNVYAIDGGGILQYNVYIMDGDYYDNEGQRVAVYLAQKEVAKAIHTYGISIWKSSDGTSTPNPVYDALKEDILLNNTAELIPMILENRIRVLFYNGQLDGGRCNNLGTHKCLNEMNYNGDWMQRAYNVVRFGSNDGVSGYVKQSNDGLLTYHVVSNAGHMVPQDVPETALKMIYTFVEDSPWV